MFLLNIFRGLWDAILKGCTEIVGLKEKLGRSLTDTDSRRITELSQYLRKSRRNKMLLVCASCGHENQPDAFYCDECGELLTNNPVSSSVEEDTNKIQENYPEESMSPSVSEAENYPEESMSPSASEEIEVDTILQSETQLQSETEKVEPPSSPIPVGIPTRLEIDEPPKQALVSPPTTLELPKLSKAILINQETGEKLILPSEEKVAYIGRLNDEFSIQIDLSHIPHADLISRVHAAIHLDNEVYYLEDAGSSNGTWLNDTQIQSGTRFRQKLTAGDTIAFGRHQTIKLTFDLEDS